MRSEDELVELSSADSIEAFKKEPNFKSLLSRLSEDDRLTICKYASRCWMYGYVRGESDGSKKAPVTP